MREGGRKVGGIVGNVGIMHVLPPLKGSAPLEEEEIHVRRKFRVARVGKFLS